MIDDTNDPTNTQANDTFRAIALYGAEEPPAKVRVLEAGGLSAELVGGELRHIRAEGIEVIRAIQFLIRDVNWGTYKPDINMISAETLGGEVRVTYGARCGVSPAFDYRAEIVLSAREGLAFRITGAPTDRFETNRLGFVVLHPLKGVVGAPVTVTHTDGRREETRFPELVSPAQPIFDIRALTHAVRPGLTVTCAMEGDAYEMEDQRNWTDASFKTYIRPLAKPRPYAIERGERVVQSVTLGFSGPLAAAATVAGKAPIAVRLGEESGRTVPPIGVSVTGALALTEAQVCARARDLAPAHLLSTLDIQAPDIERLASEAELARALGAALVVEAILPAQAAPAAEAAALKDHLRAAGVQPAFLKVFLAPYLKSYQPSDAWPDTPPFEAFYAAVRDAVPGVPIGGGMYSYFTELNRARSAVEGADFVTYATSPLIHDADDRAVMESHEALASIFATTRAFAGDRPRRIGPAMIGMRQNPYGAAPLPNPENKRLAMAAADPRQRGLFAAAWYLAYVAEAVRHGIDRLTLAALTGPAGLIHHPGGWPMPEAWRASWPDARAWPTPWYDGEAAGALFPAYHVIRALTHARGKPVLALESADPGAVQGVAWRDESGVRALVANLTAAPVEVQFEGAGPLRFKALDVAAFTQAAQTPEFLDQATHMQTNSGAGALRLDAYAVALAR